MFLNEEMENTEREAEEDEDSIRYSLSGLISDSIALADFSWNNQVEAQGVESMDSVDVEYMMDFLKFFNGIEG